METTEPLNQAIARVLRGRTRKTASIPGFRSASVLIPLVPREDTVHVAFLQRAEDGRTHSGQIAFPGGAHEATDRDAVATALREAHEEVNIEPATVRALGLLDDNATISRYVVTPVVGALSTPPRYRPDPVEVQQIFEIPLPYLLDPSNERRVPDVLFLGKLYALYEYRYQDWVIWGLTGRILHDFLAITRKVNDAHAFFQ